MTEVLSTKRDASAYLKIFCFPRLIFKNDFDLELNILLPIVLLHSLIRYSYIIILGAESLFF